MQKFKFSSKAVDLFGGGIVLIGLAICDLTNNLWPGIILAVGCALAVKHALQKKILDAALFLLVPILIFFIITYPLTLPDQFSTPILLSIPGLYILIKGFTLIIKEKRTPNTLELEK